MRTLTYMITVCFFLLTLSCSNHADRSGVFKTGSPDRLKFMNRIFSAKDSRTLDLFATLPKELKSRSTFVLLQPHRTSNDSHIVYKLPNDADTLLVECYLKRSRSIEGDKYFHQWATSEYFVAIMGKVLCDGQWKSGNEFKGINVWFSRSRMEAVVEHVFENRRDRKMPLWWRYEVFSLRENMRVDHDNIGDSILPPDPKTLSRLKSHYKSRLRKY